LQQTRPRAPGAAPDSGAARNQQSGQPLRNTETNQVRQVAKTVRPARPQQQQVPLLTQPGRGNIGQGLCAEEDRAMLTNSLRQTTGTRPYGRQQAPAPLGARSGSAFRLSNPFCWHACI